MGDKGLFYVWTGIPNHGNAWRCLLSVLFPGAAIIVNYFSDAGISRDILDAKLHLVEVWDESLENPIGFSKGLQMARSGLRVLLFFARGPEAGFEREGPCWITPLFEGLKDKIEALIKADPPGETPFRDLVAHYPILLKAIMTSSSDGHHGHPAHWETEAIDD